MSAEAEGRALHARASLLLALGGLAAVVVLLTTRLGVFLIFDVLGDIGAAPVVTLPSAGPAVLASTLEPAEHLTLPNVIEQVSGIDHLPGSGHFILNTDQTELFELDAGLQSIVARAQLRDGPLLLRQGSIEGVARAGEGEVLVAGEFGGLARWQRGNGWSERARVGFGEAMAELEFAAIAVDTARDRVFLAAEDGPIIWVSDLEGHALRTLLFSPELKPGRTAGEYHISGLDYVAGATPAQDTLYAVTENYAALFALDPQTGRARAAWGLADAGEVSDVAVVGDRVFVSADHDLFDERPGVRVFLLP